MTKRVGKMTGITRVFLVRIQAKRTLQVVMTDDVV